MLLRGVSMKRCDRGIKGESPQALSVLLKCMEWEGRDMTRTTRFCEILFVMESSKMHRQVALMRQSLFDQGFLDEQFIQLEELQDDANPNFVEEVVTLYYRDSARLIHNIEQALERSPLDFNRLDSNMHQFKGSSTSIGAKKVKSECTNFGEYCLAGNGEGCVRSFQQLKKEYATLRKKLETYFQLARQAGPKDAACRRK